MPKVSSTKFAAMFEVSTQRVARWIALGMPASKPGTKGNPRTIDVKRATAWLVRREVAKHLANDGGESSASVARRRAIAEADRAQLRATRLANSLISRTEADALLDQLIAIASKHMGTLPDILADRIAVESSPAAIRQMVFTEARIVRDRIAAEFSQKAAKEEAGDGN